MIIPFCFGKWGNKVRTSGEGKKANFLLVYIVIVNSLHLEFLFSVFIYKFACMMYWLPLIWAVVLLELLDHPLHRCYFCLGFPIGRTNVLRRQQRIRLGEMGDASQDVNAPKKRYTNPYTNVYDDLSEAERQEVMDLAFGDGHKKELPNKVAVALEQDYDISQGVNPNSRRPLPIKANIDLMVHRAKNQTDYNKRAELYQRCIDYNPTDGRAWLGLARIHTKKGKIDLAIKAYKDGLYYSPQNPFLLQSWAVLLEKQGRIAEATKLLTKSIKANPKHAASWVALAKIHQRTGRLDEARFCYNSACEGDPRSYVALQAWGMLESNSDNVALARDLFSRANRVSGLKSAHALQAWATLEKRIGNLEEAQRLLETAIRSNPDNSKVRTSMAELHELRGEMDATRAVYENGQAAAEAVGDAGFFQSWALFELRQEEASMRSEEATGRRRGGGAGVAEPFPVDGLGASTSESSLLPPTKVRLLLKRAVTINKFHSASWVAWAKYEQRCGNIALARRLLVAGISHFPHSRNAAWFHCSLGRLSCQDGDMNTARACYDRALSSSPPQQSLNIWLEYAKMEDQYGSETGARKLLEGAVRRFAADDRAWDAFLEFEIKQSGTMSAVSLRDVERGRSGAAGDGTGGSMSSPSRNVQHSGPTISAAADAVRSSKAVVSLLQRRAVEQEAAQAQQIQRKQRQNSERTLTLDELELPEGSTMEVSRGVQREDAWDSDDDEGIWVGFEGLFGPPPPSSKK